MKTGDIITVHIGQGIGNKTGVIDRILHSHPRHILYDVRFDSPLPPIHFRGRGKWEVVLRNYPDYHQYILRFSEFELQDLLA